MCYGAQGDFNTDPTKMEGQLESISVRSCLRGINLEKITFYAQLDHSVNL